MMKKLLMYCTVFMAGTAMMFAQFPSIGIIGAATSVGWGGPDIDMATTDGVVYTLDNVTLTAGGLKFRQDNAWNGLNWGNNAAWPSGVGIQDQNGQDIQAQPGVYDITFNLTTKEYNFEDVGGFSEVSITGEGVALTLSTLDGINYFLENAVISTTSTLVFSADGTNWGSADFPSGTAVEGSSLNVPANNYNITFNLQTGAYNFAFVRIGMIGAGVTGNWDVDTDMATTDGVHYTMTFDFPGGDGKFRLNDVWGTAWGSTTFPMGTGDTAGGAPNIPIPAGTWNVSFNRATGEYAFSTTAATKGFTKGAVMAYPNPASSAWTFSVANSTLTNVQVIDLTGKVVVNQPVNAQTATVNASALANGVYFAKVTAAEGVSTIRIVKN